MKAGVITFHSANNYGANLQTWALQKVLKNYGVEAGVIHYHPDVLTICRSHGWYPGNGKAAKEIQTIP